MLKNVERTGGRSTLQLRLTVEEILAWADAHYRRTGRTPDWTSRVPIPEAPTENWSKINEALKKGRRGFPSGSSLSTLLLIRETSAAGAEAGPLSIEQIQKWAVSYYERAGRWPNRYSGPVDGVPGETWLAIDLALRRRLRGLDELPRRCSLRVLFQRATRPQGATRPASLSVKEVLAWCDSYRATRGEWPTPESGPITEAPGYTWKTVEWALRNGRLRLRGRSSLWRLLQIHRSSVT